MVLPESQMPKAHVSGVTQKSCAFDTDFVELKTARHRLLGLDIGVFHLDLKNIKAADLPEVGKLLKTLKECVLNEWEDPDDGAS